MVSQSGNLGLQLLVSADRRKGGVGKFIGVGNEAMIDAVLAKKAFDVVLLSYNFSMKDRLDSRLQALHDALSQAKNVYWAEQVEIHRRAAAAWVSLGE